MWNEELYLQILLLIHLFYIRSGMFLFCSMNKEKSSWVCLWSDLIWRKMFQAVEQQLYKKILAMWGVGLAEAPQIWVTLLCLLDAPSVTGGK